MSGVAPSGLLGLAGRRLQSRRLDLTDLPRGVKALALFGIGALIVLSAFLVLQTADLVPGGVFPNAYLGDAVPRALPVLGLLGFSLAAACLAAAAVQPGRRFGTATLLTLSGVGAFITLFSATQVRLWIFDRTFSGQVVPSAVLPWTSSRMLGALGCTALGAFAAAALAVVATREATDARSRMIRVTLAGAPFAFAALAVLVSGYTPVRLPTSVQDATGLPPDVSGAEIVGFALAPRIVGTLLLLPAYWTVVESAHATRDVARSVAAGLGRLPRVAVVALAAAGAKLVYLALGLASVPLLVDAAGGASLRSRPAVSWLVAIAMAGALAVVIALPRRRVLPERGLRPAVLVLLSLLAGGSILFCVLQWGATTIVAFDLDLLPSVDSALGWTFRASTWEWGALPAMLLALLVSVPLLRRPATRAAGALCLIAGVWGMPMAILAWSHVSGNADAAVLRYAAVPAQVDVVLSVAIAALLLPVWRGRPAAPPAFLLTVLAASTIAAHTSRHLSGNSLAFDGILLVLAIAYLFLLDSAETNTRGPERPVRVLRAVGLAVLGEVLAFAALSYATNPAEQGDPARYFIYTPLVVVVVAAWFLPAVRPSGPPPPPPPGPREPSLPGQLTTARLPRPPWWHNAAPPAPGVGAATPRRWFGVIVISLAALVAIGGCKTFVDGASETLDEPAYGPGPWVRLPVPRDFTPAQLALDGGEAVVALADAGDRFVGVHQPAAGGCAAAWFAVGGVQDLGTFEAFPIPAVSDVPGARFRLGTAGDQIADLACWSYTDAGTDRVVFLGSGTPFDEPAAVWRVLAARVRFGIA